MKTYKRTVALCCGLCAVLASGAVNALFMTPHTEYFQSLILPKMSLVGHDIGWLFGYLSIAVILAEFLIEPKLRKRIFAPILLIVGNALWCAVFFRLHNAAAAFSLLCALVILMIYTTILTVRHTKYTAFFAAALSVWYVYLVGLNLLVIIFN